MAYSPVKRGLDVLVALIGLVMLTPLLIAIATVIGFTMGTPVLFRQGRPGRDGAPFELIKFRTMLLGEEPDAERLTRFGRFLRSTSLDELPELWNVLKGEMSLVGPRPLLTEYLDRYSHYHSRRHDVRPGLTGLAQVSGRNALSWDDRLDLDIEYVSSRSALLDMSILVRTMSCVIRRHGISAEGEATMPAFAGSGSVIDLRNEPAVPSEPSDELIRLDRSA